MVDGQGAAATRTCLTWANGTSLVRLGRPGRTPPMKALRISLLVVVCLAALGFYGMRHFARDKQALLELKAMVGNGDLGQAFQQMDSIGGFQNPLIDLSYQRWKKKMVARFITHEEVLENTSGNAIVNDVSNIYRAYWRAELMKTDPADRTDSTLYHALADYMLSRQLTALTKDSLERTIKNDVELGRILAGQGFKSRFLLRNGIQEVLIWNKETSAQYTVALPKDTVRTKVVFIADYALNGYDEYATFGFAQVGGWAEQESATLYCNRDQYDLGSEVFEVSYLKHETLHFTDLNAYPNLSPADLEYRAKVIELIYCTEATMPDRIAQFVREADGSDRSHSHPYANHVLMTALSDMLFQRGFEQDLAVWSSIPVEAINRAAAALYAASEATLRQDPERAEVI